MSAITDFFKSKKNMVKITYKGWNKKGDLVTKTAWIPKGHEDEYVVTRWGVFKKDQEYTVKAYDGTVLGTATGWEWYLDDERRKKKHAEWCIDYDQRCAEEKIVNEKVYAMIPPEELEGANLAERIRLFNKYSKKCPEHQAWEEKWKDFHFGL